MLRRSASTSLGTRYRMTDGFGSSSRRSTMHRSTQAIQLTAIVLLLFCGVNLTAQTITANVNGTVTDASHAVIPGATITAINVDTNVRTNTTSNNAGIYNIRFLQV